MKIILKVNFINVSILQVIHFISFVLLMKKKIIYRNLNAFFFFIIFSVTIEYTVLINYVINMQTKSFFFNFGNVYQVKMFIIESFTDFE